MKKRADGRVGREPCIVFLSYNINSIVHAKGRILSSTEVVFRRLILFVFLLHLQPQSFLSGPVVSKSIHSPSPLVHGLGMFCRALDAAFSRNTPIFHRILLTHNLVLFQRRIFPRRKKTAKKKPYKKITAVLTPELPLTGTLKSPRGDGGGGEVDIIHERFS